jgi:Ras-related protein Rab-22
MNTRNNNNSNSENCKVVILGESGVGKTSILNRYIKNSFEIENPSTSGASYATKTMHFEQTSKNIKFDIWDTAGQEKFRTLTKIFYKDTSVALLVYDITREDSFQEIKNYWYHQIKEHSPKKTIIAIAANKGDLYEEEKIDETEGRSFAKQIGAIFRYTSAKNSSGIDELFKAIGNKLIDPNYEEGGKVEEDLEYDKIRASTVKLQMNNKSKKNEGGCGC